MPLKLNSASGGSVTLDVPATASNFTLTVPAATGTVLTTASTSGMAVPAFNYVASISQSITPATFTKVTFASQVFDTTSGMFSSSRFTPTVAGYYQITGSIYFGATTTRASAVQTLIYVNGTSVASTVLNIATANQITATVQCSTLQYLNGTTDYVELYGNPTSGSGNVFLAGSDSTYLTACLVRGA